MLQFIEGGLAETGPLAGDGYFIALKWTDPAEGVTSLKVGLVPSEGTGMIECIDDTDRNGVFKIASKDRQKIKFIQSDGTHRNIQLFDISGLTLAEVEGA